MSIGIEFLIFSLIVLIFSNGGIYSLIYGVLSVIAAFVYYLFYIREYKKIKEEERNKYKSQINHKIIIISLMMITINLVYSLGILNLIFGCLLLICFVFKFCFPV